MVYDSKCARVNCDAKVTDPVPDSNTTVVKMIRRLIAEMTKYHIRIHWVKVRGHSNEEGNDKADKAATWGQNGGSKNVEDMQECMAWLEESTRAEQEDTETASLKAVIASQELRETAADGLAMLYSLHPSAHVVCVGDD